MTPDEYGTSELFPMPGGGDPVTSEERQKATRSIAWGNCPSCTNTRVGVTRSATHLVWRDHAITTWSGARIPCRASGTALCETPEREPYVTPQAGPVRCPHERSAV